MLFDTASQSNLVELAGSLASGELVLHDFIDTLESRFRDVEPQVMAFVEEPDRFERLRRDAERLLNRFPAPSDRPPLFGVPVAVKDIFNVEGLPTRAGTTLPPEVFEGPEAPAVTRLVEAGALILGKSVCTEFAYLAPGPTRNPHDLEHTPGGSSSGSAAAVAAGLSPLALGSQTVGSLIRPGAYCGITAFLPTQDRVPREGVVPLAPQADHVGLHANDVASLELGLNALVSDWTTEDERDVPVLGLPHERYLRHAEDSARAHFGMVCELLETEGIRIIRTDALEDFDALFERHMDLCAVGAAAVHAEWRTQWPKKYDPRTLKLIDRAKGVDDRRHQAVHDSCDALRRDLEEDMTRHGIDLWLAPATTGPAPLGLGSTGNGIMNAPWTHAHLPTLGLPAGRTADGLPMGVQLIGRAGDDESVLAQGRHLEPLLARP